MLQTHQLMCPSLFAKCYKSHPHAQLTLLMVIYHRTPPQSLTRSPPIQAQAERGPGFARTANATAATRQKTTGESAGL